MRSQLAVVNGQKWSAANRPVGAASAPRERDQLPPAGAVLAIIVELPLSGPMRQIVPRGEKRRQKGLPVHRGDLRARAPF
jgi:hypothetical protein